MNFFFANFKKYFKMKYTKLKYDKFNNLYDMFFLKLLICWNYLSMIKIPFYMF